MKLLLLLNKGLDSFMLEKLRLTQPVAIKILENSLISNHLSHAYLFSGSKGSLTKEAALLLAQTMVCENKQSVFACEECNSCRRVLENNYVDLIVIDGNNRKIKKEEVLELQMRFTQTGLEKAGKKVYIIHQVENATNEALNSLLKFLEEPASSDMLAILTSENPDQLLPTILSRTQIIPFVSQGAIQLETSLSIEIEDDLDRYLVANMVSDATSAVALANDEAYKKAKEIFEGFLNIAKHDLMEADIYLQKSGFSFRSKEIKQVVDIFCQIAYIFFKDCAYQHYQNISWWDEAVDNQLLKGISLKAMTTFNEGKDRIQTNANMNLLVDQMMFSLIDH
jgi:DNA polymerase-3 subunit delta'